MGTGGSISCEEVLPSQPPGLVSTSICPGIDLEECLFLISSPPCCAQSALPYWAKVTGTVKNNTNSEKTIHVTIILFDREGVTLDTSTDELVLDTEEEGVFEIKLKEFKDITKKYAIEIEETQL